MDAGGAADESAYPRTVKSCGPDAPTLASSFAEATPRGDGGKKARSPGRARNKLLKPSRAGMPGDPGATVVTNSCASLHFAHEAAGATGTRHSPLPPWGSAHALCWAKESCINSGATRRENAEARLMNTDSQHFRPSSPPKAGDPVFRVVSEEIEELRRTGYSACAEYDGLCKTTRRAPPHSSARGRKQTRTPTRSNQRDRCR